MATKYFSLKGLGSACGPRRGGRLGGE